MIELRWDTMWKLMAFGSRNLLSISNKPIGGGRVGHTTWTFSQAHAFGHQQLPL